MINKVMLTMESRIHGDMYVRFGGRLVETYHRKVEKRCWPSLLKELADICGIKKTLTTHVGRHTFATFALANGVSIESVAKMLGHTNVQMTRHYARVLDRTVIREMSQIKMDLHFSM